MTFVDPVFPVFFLVVLALYAPAGHRLRNLVLLVASAVFYGWAHPSWVVLLAASASVDWAAAIGMERWPERKGPLLVASLAANLGLLGWFKYVGFATENLRLLGVDVPLAEVVLPAGISFYTFQSMSYAIDVYRGDLRACRSLADYLVFVSFFPQLVAGPIERAKDLLAQVVTPRTLRLEDAGRGLVLIAWGAAKKCVIADNVAVYVDRLFGLDDPGLLLTLAGASAFSVQILADFSGYTDMARGAARILGFSLSPNFLHPYLAAHPGELWRRWHVSFSSWIRDYLYIPLGGGRGGPARVAAVTVLTMAMSGLWHGASWNFVAWGVFHGVLVVVYRPIWPLLRALPRVVTVPVFYMFTVFGWAIFRQHDMGALLRALAAPLAHAGPDERVVAAVVAGVGAAGGATLVLGLLAERYVVPRLGAARAPAAVGFVSTVATALVFWARGDADAFIYFRF